MGDELFRKRPSPLEGLKIIAERIRQPIVDIGVVENSERGPNDTTAEGMDGPKDHRQAEAQDVPSGIDSAGSDDQKLPNAEDGELRVFSQRISFWRG